MPPLADLEGRWRDLEARAEGSFFTSWAWIGSWLATAPEQAGFVITAYANGKVVGLAVACRERRVIGRILPRDLLTLHQNAAGARLFMEYNDILVDRACADAVRRAILSVLINAKNWDELHIPGATDALDAAIAGSGLLPDRRSRLCPWVDLAVCGRSQDDYLAVLSRNTRQQLRRALRLAAADGPLTITQAATYPEAEAYLWELRDLHQASWQGRGEPGAFADPVFRAFAAAIIRAPGVELLRIAGGARTIGVLLNFVHQGRVYAYQSGFAPAPDNRFKPGLVSHVLAITDSLEKGRSAYHFMAGEGRYKESLATDEETLHWLVLSRPGPETALLRMLRRMKSALPAPGAKIH